MRHAVTTLLDAVVYARVPLPTPRHPCRFLFIGNNANVLNVIQVETFAEKRINMTASGKLERG